MTNNRCRGSVHGRFVVVRQTHAAPYAARVLARSKEPRDADLLVEATRKYPDAVFIWLALSRHEELSPSARARAKEMWEDKGGPVGARCAAGLIVAREDQTVYWQMMAQIRAYLEEFASREHAEFLQKRLMTLDAASPEKQRFGRGLVAGQEIPGVLLELPDEVLRANLDMLLDYFDGGIGQANTVILARRLPQETVEMMWRKGVSPDMYRGLFVAAHYQPEVEAKARSLMPAEEWAKLQQAYDEHGMEAVALTATTLSLWYE